VTSSTNDQLQVDVVSRDVYVIAAAQFERPFDYSSSTWGIPPGDVTSCPARNASKLRSAHARGLSGSDVGVFITRDLDSGTFHYFLQVPDNPPYFRFTAAGTWQRLLQTILLFKFFTIFTQIPVYRVMSCRIISVFVLTLY